MQNFFDFLRHFAIVSQFCDNFCVTLTARQRLVRPVRVTRKLLKNGENVAKKATNTVEEATYMIAKPVSKS